MDGEQLQKILENQARMDERINVLAQQIADLKELTETVQRLALTIERQGMALQSTERKVDSVKSDVDEIKAKPAKRWDTIIAAIITGIVGFLLARFGLK